MRKVFSFLVLMLLTSFTVSSASDIRMLEYAYRDPAVKFSSEPLFVICDECPPLKRLELQLLPPVLKQPLVIKAHTEREGSEALQADSESPATPEKKAESCIACLPTSGSVSQIELIRTESVHFSFDSSFLNDREKNKIKEFIIPQPGEHFKEIKVTGYTCDIGSQQYNNTLALKRAQAVSEFLTGSGIKNVPVTVEGMGKCCYVSKDRRLNRRAEIKLYIEKQGGLK